MAQTYTVNGQPVSEQQFKAHWNSVLGSDPVVRNLRTMLEQQKPAIGSPQRKAFEAAVDKRLAELGFGNSNSPTGTADHDMRAHFKDGKLVVDRGSYLDRNKDWIAALGVGAAILGPFAAAWLAAPGVPGGLSAGSTVPALPGATGLTAPPAGLGFSAGGSATFLPSGVPAAATGTGIGGSTLLPAAAKTAMATGPTAASVPDWQGPLMEGSTKKGSWAAKLFDKDIQQDLLKAGIGSGLGYLQRRSERNADREAVGQALAEQQKATDAANARLDRQGRLRGEILNSQRGDFNNLAMPGFSTLSELLGLGRPQPIGPLTFQNAPPTNPSATMSSVPSGTVPPLGEGGSNFNPRVGQPGVGMRSLADFSGPSIGMVQMRSPDGAEIEWVPPDQVQHFESKGAVRI